MSKGKRARYTLEFKIEAVRLVRGGQSVGAVSVQCEVLGVSPSGFHAHWRRRASPERRKRVGNDALLVHIKAIHAEVKGE